MRAYFVRDVGTEDQQLRQRTAALIVRQEVADQLDPHLAARVLPVRAPGAVQRVLVEAHGTGEVAVPGLEPRQLEIDLGVLRRRFAHPLQHLPRRLVLVAGRQRPRQGQLILALVPIDRRRTAERADGRVSAAPGEVGLPFLKPGRRILQPELTIGGGSTPGQEEAGDDDDAQQHQHDDLALQQREDGRHVARGAHAVDERPATCDAGCRGIGRGWHTAGREGVQRPR